MLYWAITLPSLNPYTLTAFTSGITLRNDASNEDSTLDARAMNSGDSGLLSSSVKWVLSFNSDYNKTKDLELFIYIMET